MNTCLSKSFTVELRDLYPSADSWTRVTVFYDAGEICAQPLKDEFGREWALKELSIADFEIIHKSLVLQLVADENAEACGYIDDPSDEFDRAEERMTILMERLAL